MQERVLRLNRELEHRFGTTVALRIGVNTGEVMAGDASTRQAIVTGDAVNVAARLEQAALPGEILIGEQTERLVRDAVIAEPVAPLQAKGKTEPLGAYRLLDVPLDRAPTGPKGTAQLVGRRQELRRLHEAFAEATGGRCMALTIVGDPGVGKSRLVSEFTAALGPPVSVLRGRCLPYGEGITFWPVREMVRGAGMALDDHAPDEAVSNLRAAMEPASDAELVATRIAQAIGLAFGVASREEIAWAIRRWFESLADEGPLVLIVDDIQWSEDTLRQLLADLPRLSPRAPILLLCLARAELLEAAPDWGPTLRLEPLDSKYAQALVREVLGDRAEAELIERVASRAGGNPLFAQEMAKLLVEQGSLGPTAGIEIPPNLTILLEARLAQLPEPERAALERGSVEGEVFHRGAVIALSDADSNPNAGDALEGLVHRGILRLAPAAFVNDAAYSFGHLLLRDAAYRAIPKKLRARLHEGFAGWIEAQTTDRIPEYEEIIGYHLEQAYRSWEALGPLGEDQLHVGGQAARYLGNAARRAIHRGDASAAVNLLERATSLLPADDRSRAELLISLGRVLEAYGDHPQRFAVVAEAKRAAQAVGDAALHARATVVELLLRMRTEPERAVNETREVLDVAIPEFEAAGDSAGLALGWTLRAWLSFLDAQAAQTEEATARAVAFARDAGDRWQEVENLSYLAEQGWRGPRPVEAALSRCDVIEAQGDGNRRLGAQIALHRAVLEAWGGRFDEARRQVTSARTTLEELGLVGDLAFASLVAGEVELAADDPAAAEAELGPVLGADQSDEEADVAAALGESLYRQGRFAEAQPLVDRAGQLAVHLAERARVRGLQAKLMARAGRVGEAEAMGRHAVELLEGSDYLHARAGALMDLGEALGIARRWDAAATSLSAAIRLYEQKGNKPFASRASARLADLLGDRIGSGGSE
jgi:tetratricopeptide (TPR) repeat protein